MVSEQTRLEETRTQQTPWKKWGPYLSERQWGTVREDVEEAWRIVDPALQARTPVFEYEPKTWGPKEVEQVTPPGGWQNPSVRG